MKVVVVGAGVGGLVAALELARLGHQVTVLERATTFGGTIRETFVGGVPVDAGPTVLTMRWVFDELLAPLGQTLDDLVELLPLEVLARHFWGDGARLDLFADLERSAEAVGAFAGAADGRAFLEFHRDARRIYGEVEGPFLRSQRPGVGGLLAHAGLRPWRALTAIDSGRTMWRALSERFADPRLRQLFARYATYTGSSPMRAPATLNLVAHVEQSGVWAVAGGMRVLATALARRARGAGAELRCGASVERIDIRRGAVTGVCLEGGEVLEADAVVHAAGVGALRRGLLGPRARRAAPRGGDPSLSALTWALRTPVGGAGLVLHNVAFSDDYPAEFRDLFEGGRLPRRPTVYVCAQDRAAGVPAGSERLLVLVNAPARRIEDGELDRCERSTFEWLARCGVPIDAAQAVRTTPMDFARAFPGSDGALYGAATHGWRASLARGGARTRIRGLFLAGGEVHPGAGVPMAALSGRRAAEAVCEASPSTVRWSRAAMRGGTSTPSTRPLEPASP